MTTSTHKALWAALLALGLTWVAAPHDAHALDGYQDRRGLFTGIGVGGGPGFFNLDNEADFDTFADQAQLGFFLNGVVGGGINEWLAAAADINWWVRTVDIGSAAYENHHFAFNAVGNIFLFDTFVLEAGGGLAYMVRDSRNNSGRFTIQEMGLATKLGAGFEFFVNGDIAAGFKANYMRHFYRSASFDTIGGSITLRWY